MQLIKIVKYKVFLSVNNIDAIEILYEYSGAHWGNPK